MTTTALFTRRADPSGSPGPLRLRRLALWRTAGVACAVALAHIALLWSAIHAMHRPEPRPVAEIVMASVVLESATPTARPARSAASIAPSDRPATQAKPMHTPTMPAMTPSPSPSPSHSTPDAPAAATTPLGMNDTANRALQGSGAAGAAALPSNPPALPAVVLPSADADYLNNPAPAYPRQSRRLGEEGLVVVRVLIGLQGKAEQAEIRTSSGHDRLDQAALETVQRWRYVPGKRNGTAAAMWFNIPVRFVLE